MDNYTEYNNTIFVDDAHWWMGETFLLAFHVLQLTLFVFGVCSNCLLVTIVVKFQDMKSSTNFFLANLAAADILILILVVLPIPVNYFTSGLFRFLTRYYISLFAYQATVPISTFTLTLVAAERYYVITHPLKAAYTITKCRTLMAIGFVWIVSIALSIPVIFFGLFSFVGHVENYLTAMDVVCVFLPLIVIIALNIFICKQLYKNRSPGVIDRNTSSALTQNRQVILMISIVTTVLFLCFLPLKIYGFMTLYGWWDTLPDSTDILYYASDLLYTVNSVINPIVYGFVNTKFRRAMRKMLMSGT